MRDGFSCKQGRNDESRKKATKWLDLGHETYGERGVAALAEAMGLRLSGHSIGSRAIPRRLSQAEERSAIPGYARQSRARDFWDYRGDEEAPGDDWQEMSAALSCDDALRACKGAGRGMLRCLQLWSLCKRGIPVIAAPGTWGSPEL